MQKKQINRTIISNELLFCVYLFLPAVARIIIKENPDNSFLILLIPTTIIVILSFIKNLRNNRNIGIDKTSIIIFFVTTFLFLLSSLFSPNSVLEGYYREYIIFGAITLFLFSNISDYRRMVKLGAYVSIAVFLIFFIDPLNNYYFFNDYMNFGFMCMLPVFFFCALGRYLFKKKLFIIFEILSIIEILFFCNRGSLLCVIVLEVIFIFKRIRQIKRKPTRIISIAALLIMPLILFANIDTIMSNTINELRNIGIKSYSIKTISKMIDGNSTGLSGRDIIWSNANQFYNQSPLVGNGIGSFEAQYGYYSHNIILDMTTSFGTAGIVLLLIIIVNLLINANQSAINEKTMYIALIAMAITPLLFSIYVYKWPYFWMMIYASLSKKKGD